ncbi:hypothetical protein [Peribacillus loiseleuriae]|uniref:hypothetical protein n=1 Tax=Peribacillus loiseleuriae TaxID=1679170 RepID=UPI003CFDE073
MPNNINEKEFEKESSKLPNPLSIPNIDFNTIYKIQQNIAPILETINNFYKFTNTLSYQIAVSLNNLHKSFEPIRETLKNINISKTMERFKQGIIETEEDLKVFKFAMVDMGYPPHYSIDISTMRSIAQEYSDNKEETSLYMDEFMKKYYDEDIITEIAMIWEKADILKNRLHLLRNVKNAYNLGMYSLVVPSLLSQFEGILVQAFNITGYVDGKIQRMLIKHLLLNSEDSNRDFLDFDEAIHSYYSNKILDGFKHGHQIDSDVSRHAILHGGDTNFGDQTVAIKLILLFDYLVDSIGKLDDKTIIKAQSEVKQYQDYLELRNNRNNKTHIKSRVKSTV